MSKSPYLMGDSMIKYSYKPKDDHHHHHHHHSHKAKGITFLASIFSFFIFMTSTMYVLNNTSYTTLFNNNIFWFFMSNTLILFIAADYEAFSSSKNNTKQDHYVRHTQEAGQAGEDQMYAALPLQAETMTSKSRDNSLTVAPRVTLKASRNINKYNHIIDHEEQVHEKSMVIPNYSPLKKQRPISESTPEERVLEIVVQNNNKDDDEQKNERSKLGRDEEMKRPIYPGGRAVGRSKSDRHVVKRVVIDERKNKVMMRSRSETMEKKKKKEEVIREKEENNYNNNEFSSMSNEELNRRVEEFIQRFNRQMRLQAQARNYNNNNNNNNVVNVH